MIPAGEIDVAPLADHTTEAQLQNVIVGIARFYGWSYYHTLNSRGSNKGWPDLVLWKPPRVLAVELKSARGRVRPEQLVTLNALALCGIEVALIRPADIDRIVNALGPRQERLVWPTA